MLGAGTKSRVRLVPDYTITFPVTMPGKKRMDFVNLGAQLLREKARKEPL